MHKTKDSRTQRAYVDMTADPVAPVPPCFQRLRDLKLNARGPGASETGNPATRQCDRSLVVN